MTAEDQVAVTGVLEGGAVAAVHFRGGLSRGTNFQWEINGTDGDLVITGGSGQLQFGQVTLHGAQGRDTTLSELPVPARYERISAFVGRRPEVAHTVAHAYAQLLADLADCTQDVPSFDHAVQRHRLLHQIELAASSAERQTVANWPDHQRQIFAKQA